MLIFIRALVALIFFSLMFTWKRTVHEVVDLGFIPWLFLMAGVFWIAIKIENSDRKASGRPSYSWNEARELVAPLSALAAIIAVAYCYRAAAGY
jgi:hypothetical protein